MNTKSPSRSIHLAGMLFSGYRAGDKNAFFLLHTNSCVHIFHANILTGKTNGYYVILFFRTRYNCIGTIL